MQITLRTKNIVRILFAQMLHMLVMKFVAETSVSGFIHFGKL